MKAEKIELVTQYKDGATIKEKAVEIFAKRKSVSFNEFYAAYGTGLRPKYIFAIYPGEYKLADVGEASATHIRYGGKLYPIIRAYEVDRITMELTVG